MLRECCKFAELNIKANKMEDKYEVICGKVEDCIENLVKNHLSSNKKYKIIGIVDPPRSGLSPRVMKLLRTFKGLDKLIYVSCNPNILIDNLRGLILPETKNNRRGPPFVPICAYGIDLFP